MSITLLLAEDHDANRAVIKRRLERRGFTIDEARDGIEALRIFDPLRHACLLLDLSMPNMSGLEVLQRLRDQAQAARVPAIAITAHAFESMRDVCTETGFDKFVTKPVDFEELVACIVGLTEGWAR